MKERIQCKTDTNGFKGPRPLAALRMLLDSRASQMTWISSLKALFFFVAFPFRSLGWRDELHMHRFENSKTIHLLTDWKIVLGTLTSASRAPNLSAWSGSVHSPSCLLIQRKRSYPCFVLFKGTLAKPRGI